MKKVTATRVRRKKDAEFFPIEQEPLGLCTCCKLVQSCTYLKNPNQRVLQCEEFEGIVPTPLKILPKGKTASPSSKKNSSNPYKGLCSLCRDRLSCTFPKPEGGVWHCEEYR